METLRSETPVELISDMAMELVFRKDFDEKQINLHERNTTAMCNQALRDFGMLGKYEVAANNVFVLEDEPTMDENKKTTYFRLERETIFEGSLVGQRILKIAEIGDNAIRAACLAFEKAVIKTRQSKYRGALFVNYGVDRDDRIYVPVFAVTEINRT